MHNIPHHIAIIMDGNRRWAKAHHLEVIRGHQYAVDNVMEPLVDEAIRFKISHLTFWAWSTENWKRSKVEVEAIMRLFRNLFSEQIERLHRKGVRIETIGDLSKFAPDIQQKVTEAKEKTKNNKNITVVFAINYGGRDEIVRAVNKWLANAKRKTQNVKPQRKTQNLQHTTYNIQLDENHIEQYLDTNVMPPVDLIIRPGGEKRLSGFLLWQSAYAELYFTDVLFPDFTPEKLREAITDYQKRERRFGR